MVNNVTTRKTEIKELKDVTTRKTEIKELKDVTSVKNEKICVNNQLFFNFDTVVTNEPKIKKTVVNPEIITPAPAVVNNVMTLEPYDEDFTAFTGDYSDLDISASLNDWEAGGYSKTENKNEVTAPKFEIIKALDENYFNLVFDESKIKDVEKFKFNLALYYSLLPLIEEGNYYLLNYSERFKDFKKIRAKLSEIIGTDAYKCGLIPMSWLKGAHLLKHIDQLDMQHYRNIAKFLGLNTKGLKRKKDYFLLVQSIVNHEDYLIFLKEEKEFFNNCVIGVSVNAMEIIDERKKNNVTMPA